MTFDVELIEFKEYGEETLISVNVVLSSKDASILMDVWFNKVKSCQAPLIDAAKNGIFIHIPWILEDGS